MNLGTDLLTLLGGLVIFFVCMALLAMQADNLQYKDHDTDRR